MKRHIEIRKYGDIGKQYKVKLVDLQNNIMSIRKTNEQYYKEINEKYGVLRYDYSLVFLEPYINNKQIIKIICHNHDEPYIFVKTRKEHLKGSGCTHVRCLKNIPSNNKVKNDLIFARGDRYDYSNVDSLGYNKPIKIICKTHGAFYQKPYYHISGGNCKKCAIIESIKMTNEEALAKAINYHGDRYDYSLFDFKGVNYNIKIICKDHGEFEQNYNAHAVVGQGCPRCAGLFPNKEECIEYLHKLHNNKYDYSLFDFENRAKSKIVIICPNHGNFQQKYSAHSSGRGCKKCANETTDILNTKTNIEYINEASIKHNNLYDYSKTTYTKCYNKIIIICKKHGEFKQAASNHLDGQGCQICKIENLKSNINDIINKANIVHNFKYDYSLLKYINTDTLVEIICPIDGHGVFKQTMYNHIHRARGCKLCKNWCSSKGEVEWLNFLEIPIENRNIAINVNGRDFNVDGYYTIDKKIFEYDGDIFHGNLNIYNSEEINPITKVPYGELNKLTINKKQFLENAGYTVISIWESDWKKLKKEIKAAGFNLKDMTQTKWEKYKADQLSSTQ